MENRMFKCGDRVRPKPGGAMMTVREPGEDHSVCQWAGKDDFPTESFPNSELVLMGNAIDPIKFEVGDQCKIRSGGVRMLIVEIDGDHVICKNPARPENVSFPAVMLMY